MSVARHKRVMQLIELGGERVAVDRWRIGQLVAAGFDSVSAAWIATDRTRDLHALIELVERGCPPVLAARILAPLNEPTGGLE